MKASTKIAASFFVEATLVKITFSNHVLKVV